MNLKAFLLASLIALARTSTMEAREGLREYECIPGGWPLVVLPVLADENVYNLPVDPAYLQTELARFLIENSPFSHVRLAINDDGERLEKRFYLQARLEGGPNGGFGSPDNMIARLSIRITLAEGGGPVFANSYLARHIATDGWSNSALMPFLLRQWKAKLLRDLRDFNASGAWERATGSWRVRHADRPRILLVYDSSGASVDRSLLRRTGEILDSRNCAVIEWLPLSGEVVDADSLRHHAALSNADFVIIGHWDNAIRSGRFSWWLRSSNGDGRGTSGQTDSVDTAWQLENAARSVAADIGTFLQEERDAFSPHES